MVRICRLAEQHGKSRECFSDGVDRSSTAVGHGQTNDFPIQSKLGIGPQRAALLPAREVAPRTRPVQQKAGGNCIKNEFIRSANFPCSERDVIVWPLSVFYLAQVLQRARNAGADKLFVTAGTLEESKEAIRMARVQGDGFLKTTVRRRRAPCDQR